MTEIARPASTTIPRSHRTTGPMSFGQQRLWFQHELEPDAPHHALGRAYEIRGRLDVAALQRALDDLVRRHETLRTTFHLERGTPIQRIVPATPVPVVFLSIAASPSVDAWPAVQAHLLEDLRRPFDPAVGPVLRAAIARITADRSALILTQRFIGADRWSRAILHRELSDGYAAYVRGDAPSLPPLPLRYLDFAAWQRERLRGPVLDRLLEYWTAQLAGAPGSPSLPPDRAPVARTRAGDTVFAQLNATLTGRLSGLCVSWRVTPFMLYFAAFAVLLHRVTGDTDIVVGAPIAGRLRRETEALIGFFGNTLALRVDLSGDPSFRDVVSAVRRTTLDAYAHQELPFDRLVEALPVERTPLSEPLARVLFAFQNLPDAPLRLDGCEVEEHEAVSLTFSFELGLSLYPSEAGVLVRAQYQTDRLRRSSVSGLLKQFETLLEGIASEPSWPISRLPLLTGDERRERIAAAGTPRRLTGDAAVHRRFEAQVDRTPDAVAVTWRDDGLTYAELDQRANRLAHALRSRGVGPGALVALALPRSLDLVVSLVAALKAGAAYLPLDPRDPPARARQIMADAAASVLIADGPPRFDAGPDVDVIDLGMSVNDAALPSSRLSANVSSEDLAYVMYTSGSTGVPKGVEIPHRAVLRLVEARIVPIQSSDVVLHAAPASFDASTFEIWGALLNGARLVVFPDEVLDLAVLEDLMHRERVSHAWLTASLFNAVVDLQPAALQHVRYLLTGGEALSVPHVRIALDRHPGLRLYNGYGPTEVTTFSLVHEVERPVGADAVSIPIGRPIAFTCAFVLDPHHQVVPVGVPGELYLGGEGLARGYRRAPALTSERFVEVALDGAEVQRLYRTGDRARWCEDGTVEFLGRTDRQIKLRGFRIELDEVEAHLAAHPAVSGCAVSVEDATRMSGRLVAHVVAQGAASDAALVEHMNARVPSYMVPSIVRVGQLPLTPAGKLDRGALGRPGARSIAPTVCAEGQPPLQHVIASVWADALRRHVADPNENFFDLGGHSLLAAQVVSRLRPLCGVDLPLRAMFEHPTVAGLAAVVARLQVSPSTASGVRAAAAANAPLSYAQSRLWFLEQLHPGGVHYNSPRSFRLDGPLDLAALRRACDALVERHASLRTAFVFDGHEPGQVVHDQVEVPFLVVDLSRVAPAAREQEIHQRLLEEASRPFRLDGADALVRVLVLHLGVNAHVLMITMHHIATDGWSMGVFNRELAAVYGAYRGGRPSPLAPLPMQYADYAVWQRAELQGERLDRALAYWSRQLAGLPRLALPGQRSGSSVVESRAGRHTFVLEAGVVRAAGARARTADATLFMVLLAAFQVALARVTARGDVAVAVPVANRMRAEFEELIGFFVNIVILRIRFTGERTGDDVLRLVRHVALEAFDHQDCPFEKVVEALQPDRALGLAPLTPVLFALQTAPDDGLTLPGLVVTRQAPISDRVRFDVEMVLRREPSGSLRGTVIYRAGVQDASTIAALVERFLETLDLLVEWPERAVLPSAPYGADGVGVAPPSRRQPPRRAAPRRLEARAPQSLSTTEARVAHAWREVLGAGDIGPDENFFDLGGHSLLAARVALRLQAELGRRVPVAMLFEHGTIRELAKRLDESAGTELWTPLVPLRRSGSRKPLFLLHGLGGEVVGYRELARHLSDEQPVYAIQGRSPAAAADLPTEVEALCARYVELLTDVDPEGPYCLGAYSAGGVLALEIVRQLEAQGREVALLAVLDGGLPANARRAYRARAHTVISLARHVWFWIVDDALRMSIRDWPERVRSKMRSVKARIVRRIGPVHNRPLDIRDQLGIYRYPQEYSAFLAPRYAAYERYQPRPVASPMLFVRSRTGSLYGPPVEMLIADWRRLAKGPFTAATVPCSHSTLLKEPYVRDVARHIEAALDRVTDERQAARASG